MPYSPSGEMAVIVIRYWPGFWGKLKSSWLLGSFVPIELNTIVSVSIIFLSSCCEMFVF